MNIVLLIVMAVVVLCGIIYVIVKLVEDNETIKKLDAEIDDKNAKIANLTSLNEIVKKENSVLKDTKDRLTKENATLTNEIESLERDYVAKINEMQKLIDSANMAYTEIKEENANLIEKNKELENYLYQDGMYIKKLEEEIEELKKK